MQLHKLVVILVVIFADQVFGDNDDSGARSREKRNDIMDVIMEKVQHFVKHGSKFLNMTSLDPYKNDSIKIHVDDDDLKIRGELLDVKVNGLSNFDVPNYDFSIMKAKSAMDLIFPKITSEGRYNLSYNSDSHNAFGKFDITLNDLILTAHAKFALLAKDGVKFTKFEHVKVEKVSLNAKGEYNGKPSHLKIVADSSKDATDFVKHYHVVDFFIRKSLAFMNEKLAGKSLWALRKYFKTT